MKNSITNFLLIMATVTIAGCSNSDHKTTVYKPISKDDPSSVDTSFLNDKNYPYKNISNTSAVNFFIAKNKSADEIYTDTTCKTTYIKLNEQQRVQLISPFVGKKLDIDEKYTRDLTIAYFVSKQQKIGDFQPILIQILGNDYSALMMVILDKNRKPIKGYIFQGEKERNLIEMEDSLIRN